MTKRKFKTISILGVGLIGGSIGLAVKKRKLADKVIGLTTRRNTLAKAKRYGAIDEGTLSLKKATEAADLIIVCTPVVAVTHTVKLILPFVKSGCIMTDVGSTKLEIVSQIENFLPKDVFFIGGHPMAGSEKRGVEAASSELFEDSLCILTKTNKTHIDSLKRIRNFWKSLGARVKTVSPSSHDSIVARVSHLPHLAAVALISQLKEKDFNFVSSGFRDTTRISEANPDIWRDIFLANKKEIIKSLDDYIEKLKYLKEKVEDSNSKCIVSEFKKAKILRKRIRRTK